VSSLFEKHTNQDWLIFFSNFEGDQFLYNQFQMIESEKGGKIQVEVVKK